jgi:asparagine synthase (glutamine-hydrolysing)
MDRPVRTFTVGFSDDTVHNEFEEARRVARHFRTDHHEVIIGCKDLIDFLPQLIFHQDEPIADPVCVPLYYVARLARESGTVVVQVGEGSDELFCGYRNYAHYLNFHDYFWRHAIKLPRWLRRGVATTGSAFHRAGFDRALRQGRKLVPDLLRRFAEGEELFWGGAFVYDETQKTRLLTSGARERLSLLANGRGLTSHSVVLANLERLLAEKPDADQLERMVYGELKLRLAELLLMRVDKITMATSIEARVPFLDHKLVEFAMSLPRRMKYRDGETKYLLRRALRGVVPEWVLNRKKKGFGIPINRWMLDQMGDFVESSITGSALTRRELFDYDFVRGLMEKHKTGRVNYSFHLWTLLNVSLWYDRWIEPAD